MIHAAAKGKPYPCFVSAENTAAVHDHARRDRGAGHAGRGRRVPALDVAAYNIQGFSASAGEIEQEVRRHFPEAEISYVPVPVKAAHRRFLARPTWTTPGRAGTGASSREHGLAEALEDYLVPALKERYAGGSALRFPQRS